MNKVLKAILCILKNATIIIPLVEGVVYSVRDLVNPPLKDCKDVDFSENPNCPVKENTNETIRS